MKSSSLRNRALSLAVAACLATALPVGSAYAAADDGSLVGKVLGDGQSVVGGATVTARNKATGLERSVTADGDGAFRFPFLPVGDYVVEVKKDGLVTQSVDNVRVALQSATNVTVTLGTLETVEVTAASINSVIDVRSVESAFNYTNADLERIPVLRDAAAVALLTPGINKGDPDLGGLSFGGSSIAENTVYINGLNTTDFYNRVGFSEVPYAFFEEFQVKTGGYSVEYGRTTGGVINAVTKSGTNEWEFGTEIVWQPDFLQSSATDRFDVDGNPVQIGSHDEFDRTNVNVYASGPIIEDKLFFFALYEARDLESKATTDAGNSIGFGDAGDDFWGVNLDWQINDRNLLSLLAFSDSYETITRDYQFDFETGERGNYTDTRFVERGGDNYALTWTSYLSDSLSVKALYGVNQRSASNTSASSQDCNRIRDRRTGRGNRDIGCTRVASLTEREDEREAMRLDFEWDLGDHGLRFGLDREQNTSQHEQFYPGTDRLLFEISSTTPGAIVNTATIPAGYTAYVRSRQNEVDGEFETINQALYVEDNWRVNDQLVLNLGLRWEAFDNRDSDGETYIEINDMLAPRFGASYDVKGDGRMKVFGNLGRYFLPVANVINIKQAGGFLDSRTFYLFEGLEDFTYNGNTFQRPILGAQLGPVDNSQGDGTVGDLRGEVDQDMDPVYQDEFILGFQAMIDDSWSWGVRALYRELHNAIDDMEITASPQCGEDGALGFVMANPGKKLTVYGDSDCDGVSDSLISINTGKEGWGLYDDEGNFIGQRGFPDPKRTYTALEFVLDRAWDEQWAFNASYTWSRSEGNAEGPVNSDTDFADAGRTEAFDTPYVNLKADGPLPNDREHQFKFRGSYAFNEFFSVGATFSAISGRPISGIGVAAPGDDTAFYSFFTCIENCTGDDLQSERVFELRPRGDFGRTPWVYDLSASVTYQQPIGPSNLRVNFAVFNIFNDEETLQVDEIREDDIGSRNAYFRTANGWQTPRFAQLTVTLDF